MCQYDLDNDRQDRNCQKGDRNCPAPSFGCARSRPESRLLDLNDFQPLVTS